MEERCRVLIVGPGAPRLGSRVSAVLGDEIASIVSESLPEAESRLFREWTYPPTVVLIRPGPERLPPTEAAARLSVEPGQLVPFGPTPAPATVRSLAEAGLRWQLWDPLEDDAIPTYEALGRQIVASAQKD